MEPTVNIFQAQGPVTPQHGAQPPAPLGSPPPSPPRHTWAGKHTFLLSCLGYCVGLGNVWRFPYLCYRNGGGVGVGMLVVSSLVSIYYNVIIAWAFYYLGSSFQSPLPWSCDAPQNAELCQVVYVTATFPYLILLILLIRGATLPGSLDGVRFYLASDWSKLMSAQVWSDAASQIFYSLGIGFGGLLSMASYNKLDNNVIRDTLLIAIGNCCTSFFAGFAIFSVLGHMALKKDVPVGSVADSGPGLAFVAYPEALSLLPGSPFWSILFFLMLFMLGVDTLFGNIEAITTAIVDEFPALREWRRKTALLGVLCFSFFLLGLLLVTQGGIFWFTLVDTYSTGFGLIIITLLMCAGIDFCYGIERFCQDIVTMICRCPPWYVRMLGCFKVCWVFFTPCLLLFTLIYTFLEMYSVPLHYDTYEFPAWGTSLGICMGVLSCVHVPIYAAAAVCSQTGTLRDRFHKATQPLRSWGAATAGTGTEDIIEVPFTITLTGSDFAAPQHSES
ncbi:hypothetical protein ASZ78_011221 [Callipepla squamata]|uniref:Transporter n=1 Tax=Callipepla squamata TaxID=9009 RepID=A0A226MDH8_CALSU|nr:hypothetical protein ASZ78_011221 [Callipepla squamata]